MYILIMLVLDKKNATANSILQNEWKIIITGIPKMMLIDFYEFKLYCKELIPNYSSRRFPQMNLISGKIGGYDSAFISNTD